MDDLPPGVQSGLCCISHSTGDVAIHLIRGGERVARLDVHERELGPLAATLLGCAAEIAEQSTGLTIGQPAAPSIIERAMLQVVRMGDRTVLVIRAGGADIGVPLPPESLRVLGHAMLEAAE